MLILFDHSMPRALRRHIAGHTVHTAEQMGWERLANGLLIARAEAAGYELLISVDQGIQYQQNLAARRIAIIVLMKNDWSLIRPHTDAVNAAVNRIQPGDYIEIEIPLPPLPEYTGSRDPDGADGTG